MKAQKRHPRVHKCARTMEFLDTLIIINLKVLKCQLSSPIIFSAKLVLGMVRRSSFPVRADRPNWTSDWTASPRSAAGPGSYRRRASVDHPACIMLERWHHSSVNYSTQIQLAPQSSKLGSCARSTSRGTVLRNQAISVYGRAGLIDMASCCRCTASTRGLAIRLIGSSGQRLFQHRHTDQTQK